MSGQHLKLEGIGAFDAAVHCASVAAADRQHKLKTGQTEGDVATEGQETATSESGASDEQWQGQQEQQATGDGGSQAQGSQGVPAVDTPMHMQEPYNPLGLPGHSHSNQQIGTYAQQPLNYSMYAPPMHAQSMGLRYSPYSSPYNPLQYTGGPMMAPSSNAVYYNTQHTAYQQAQAAQAQAQLQAAAQQVAANPAGLWGMPSYADFARMPSDQGAAGMGPGSRAGSAGGAGMYGAGSGGGMYPYMPNMLMAHDGTMGGQYPPRAPSIHSGMPYTPTYAPHMMSPFSHSPYQQAVMDAQASYAMQIANAAAGMEAAMQQSMQAAAVAQLQALTQQRQHVAQSGLVPTQSLGDSRGANSPYRPLSNGVIGGPGEQMGQLGRMALSTPPMHPLAGSQPGSIDAARYPMSWQQQQAAAVAAQEAGGPSSPYAPLTRGMRYHRMEVDELDSMSVARSMQGSPLSQGLAMHTPRASGMSSCRRSRMPPRGAAAGSGSGRSPASHTPLPVHEGSPNSTTHCVTPALLPLLRELRGEESTDLTAAYPNEGVETPRTPPYSSRYAAGDDSSASGSPNEQPSSSLTGRLKTSLKAFSKKVARSLSLRSTGQAVGEEEMGMGGEVEYATTPVHHQQLLQQ